MNSNINNVPFHERHDDEPLTLEDIAQILKTSENTVRWWRQTVAGSEFFKIGRALSTPVGDLRRFIRSQPARLPASHRQAEDGARRMDDPHHIFLSASEVMARYGRANEGLPEP